MKIINSLLYFFLISPICGLSQNWAPIGTKWHFSKFYDYHLDIEEFTLIKSVGDTIINGIPSTHLTITNNWACSITDNNVFMYQTMENKIYAKINSESGFHMLYNFSAEIGDSWKFPIMFNSMYTDTLQYTVTNIYTTNINGQTRKVLSCNLEFKLGIFWYRVYTTQLIEGIGDVQYMFPWQAQICDEDYILGLRCYEDNEIGLYHYNTDVECDYITETLTPELDQNDDIEIFPNPTLNRIYLNNQELNYLKLEVIDSQGKNLFRKVGFLTEIELNELAPGLYFLKIVNSKGKTIVKKLIKN
ncbi:MAG: T9SS type A sorting domain-containing protein [Saprospiraceae bacterium]|nr:T9SS type A sorting domain-containing protein [Saprospiraceae bacterium]